MTETTPRHPTSEDAHLHEVEEYAGGTIQSRHGYLPVWLLVVYAVLFVWGVLLCLSLLGWAWAGADLLMNAELRAQKQTVGRQDMVAKIILGLAAANLFLLVSALAVNVALVYFG